MKRVYISGPMTGLPDYNRSAFYRAASELQEQGFMPVHTAWMPDGATIHEYMRASLQLLLTCDAVLLLPGWLKSSGSLAEVYTAHVCGLQALESIDRLRAVLEKCDEPTANQQ